MNIEITHSEIVALNFFYGFLRAKIDHIKEESELDTMQKTSLENQIVHLETLLRKIN